ncbi:MaoC family dehydratase [Pontibacillus yanchengensis]|uniref:Dehydratase n=1 Tax=Pontibacillus yanchengensis Y32 TaxID=1385514 RepID=A0A0A2TED9_9BACI|nr:MaoC family dehydratase [Pontibacillus yanchengensis]KGP72783.1 dehydratase [Pontibacillus yanchengensis Y32]
MNKKRQQPLVEEFPRVTYEHVARYIRASGDDNPIHYDEEVAKKAGFNRPIVHGMWTLGVMTSLVWKWYGAHVQLTKVDSSFKYPLFLGDSLLVKGEVVENRESEIEMKLIAVNQDNRTLVSTQIVIRGAR